MWIGVITLFPELISDIAQAGILGRALERGDLQLRPFDLREFADDARATADARPYGGGPGMVLMAEPLLRAIVAAKASSPTPPRVICLSPQGPTLDQATASRLADSASLLLLCGRYEGIDERVLEQAVDEEISIGDYVLSGGELPAMVLVDAVCRLLPGVVNNHDSILTESHLHGLLDYPQYTRPREVAGQSTPAVLLTGDHAAIARWRRAQSLLRTWQRRPHLLTDRRLSEADLELLAEVLAALER